MEGALYTGLHVVSEAVGAGDVHQLQVETIT